MTIFIIILIAIVLIAIAILTNNPTKEKRDDENIPTEPDIDINDNQKTKEPVKRIKFSVAGVSYEDRLKTITKIVNDMKRNEMFLFEPYMGLSNKEILEDGIRTYELSSESFPDVYLEKEDTNEFDPNAIKVVIKDAYGGLHHIGYVPARLCKEVRALMKEYRMIVASSIIGGRYKDIDIDEYGNERVRTFTSNYGVKIHLSFWDDEEFETA